MFNKTIIACVLFASLACTTLASADTTVRNKAVKAAYQGPEVRSLKVSGQAFNVKKAKVRLGPGTRVVDGQITHVHPYLTNTGIKVSYTMVFRRDGTLIDVSIRGASSTGVYDAITKRTSTNNLIDGTWKGSARYLIAEIGRAVPRDLVGTPIPPGQWFPLPGQPLPSDGGVMDGGQSNNQDEGDIMDGDEGNYDDEGDTMDGDEGNYDDEGDGDAGEENGGNPNQLNYFLGASTSLVAIPSRHRHSGYGQQHGFDQQRFGGDSYGLRINSVVPGSPAQRSGLEAGDIVISANQKPMNQQKSLTMAVAESDGQLNLILRNVRNGQSVSVVVKLDAQTPTFLGRGTRQRR
jgi:hypothetical protein